MPNGARRPAGRQCRENSTLRFVKPCLPVLVEQVPAGDDWLHEIKHDGYRTQIVIDRGTVRAFTRRGFDWTERYGPLVEAAGQLNCSRAVIDGEVIVQDADGRSDFHSLRSAIARRSQDLVLMAFDLINLDDQDLRRRGIEERRAPTQQPQRVALVGFRAPATLVLHCKKDGAMRVALRETGGDAHRHGSALVEAAEPDASDSA